MIRSLAFALAFSAAPAFAQTTAAIRATIDAISPDGATLTLHTRAGRPATLRLKPDATVTLVVPASPADLKPNAYIGVAAKPAADGVLEAMEVHVFPEASRGAGEGSRPFDLAPNGSMTNGALATQVEDVKGPMLTITYKGGAQTIRVAPDTPIVTFTPGALSDLKPGAAIIARGAKGDDGVVETARVLVGKDGLTPPM